MNQEYLKDDKIKEDKLGENPRIKIKKKKDQ
jgi:hypothetical protein